jgi:HAD superfamily hydrolase (TIGR01509 family)
MDIKVITFDLDNTLWDVEPALLRAEQAQQEWLLQHRPGTVESLDHEALWEFKKSVWRRHPQLLHHVSQIRIQMLYELQLAAGYPERTARSGAEQAFAAFLAERQQVKLYEEALGVLETLATRFILGALTNGNADVYKTDAGDYFDFAFLAQEVGASKPHPDMFHAALERTGVAASNVIHVGDDPEHDIAGARAVGMHTVWMNARGKEWPEGPRPSREISNLRQLPSAIADIAAAPAKN